MAACRPWQVNKGASKAGEAPPRHLQQSDPLVCSLPSICEKGVLNRHGRRLACITLQHAALCNAATEVCISWVMGQSPACISRSLGGAPSSHQLHRAAQESVISLVFPLHNAARSKGTGQQLCFRPSMTAVRRSGCTDVCLDRAASGKAVRNSNDAARARGSCCRCRPTF
jgi:hypothetical protein